MQDLDLEGRVVPLLLDSLPVADGVVGDFWLRQRAEDGRLPDGAAVRLRRALPAVLPAENRPNVT